MLKASLNSNQPTYAISPVIYAVVYEQLLFSWACRMTEFHAESPLSQ